MTRRFKYAKIYDKAFAGVKGIKKLPVNTAERKNAYWWYPMLVDLDVLDCDAPTIVKELGASGIPCYGIQWPEVYEEKAYTEHGGFGSVKFLFEAKKYTDPKAVEYDKVFCKNANALRSQTVCLFLHPTWEEVHIERCIEGFKKVLAAHVK